MWDVDVCLSSAVVELSRLALCLVGCCGMSLSSVLSRLAPRFPRVLDYYVLIYVRVLYKISNHAGCRPGSVIPYLSTAQYSRTAGVLYCMFNF